MGSLPPRRVAILRSSLSMPTTSLPLSARQVAVTSPTYPVPTTATFIGTPRNPKSAGGDAPPVVEHVGQGAVQLVPRLPPGQPAEPAGVGPADGGVRPAARLRLLADLDGDPGHPDQLVEDVPHPTGLAAAGVVHLAGLPLLGRQPQRRGHVPD